jgi:hypothetical protein
MTNRRIKLFAIAVGFTWIATLGIFRESNVNSSFTVQSGDAWAAFENGAEPLYPNTWLSGGRIRRLGIPYILYNESQLPPYSVGFCFTANAEPKISSLTITGLTAEYDNGQSSTMVTPDAPVIEPFQLDTRGVDRGDHAYLRVNFAFTEGLMLHDPCWLHIDGHITDDDSQTIPYSTRVRLRPTSDVYYCPGWLALVYRSL